MKKKELKNIAKKLAKLEVQLANSIDEDEIILLKREIMGVSGKAETIEDMMLIDEMVREILDGEA